MKKLLLASACILAISSASALAQNQPAPGASSEGNVGPGATKRMKKDMTTGTSMTNRKGGTAANPSSEGNVGPGTNNNSGKQPGGR